MSYPLRAGLSPVRSKTKNKQKQKQKHGRNWVHTERQSACFEYGIATLGIRNPSHWVIK